MNKVSVRAIESFVYTISLYKIVTSLFAAMARVNLVFFHQLTKVKWDILEPREI